MSDYSYQQMNQFELKSFVYDVYIQFKISMISQKGRYRRSILFPEKKCWQWVLKLVATEKSKVLHTNYDQNSEKARLAQNITL